jgi:hypothetical protein
MAATEDVSRASLYRGAINLWVEDKLTRAYLNALWRSPDVMFFIGGGNEGVRAIVNDAEKHGLPNVFALTDRDYRPSNKPHWADTNKTFRTFVMPVHEIENYLLDSQALAGIRLNNIGKGEIEIEEFMKTAAGRLCWWAACRDVVAELRHRFREGFLGDPGCDIDSRARAEDHICNSDWFRRLAGEYARTTADEIRRLIGEAHHKADGSLADGSWKNEFAGKEILRDVGSRICDQTRLGSHSPTAAEFDEDLAKQVGQWQTENNSVPTDLTDLLKALRQRVPLQASGSSS